MNQTQATNTASGNSPVIDSTKLPRTKVWGESDKAVSWQGAFALYGGAGGTTASSTIVYEIEPGKRLGWHTDATEETQYIIAGRGPSALAKKGFGRLQSCPPRPGQGERRRKATARTPAGRVA
ncbi:MAG: hypothetical protein R6X03_01125 [Methyloceanibacter sp.]